mmetsp:Transcript_14061/g.12417  ORF Transcript_14061/g.12417 Transcript_14061/m.12417 type:complete len:111 (-) Transcript_14061:101-433(-)
MLMFPYAASFSTGLTMTLSRSLSGMAFAKSEESKFGGMMPYIYVFLIVFCALFSYYLLNKSLQNFNTVYVVPLFKAFDLYHNIMSGGIFLREFGQYSSSELTFFTIGASI